jgi:hypothetical protein
MLHDVMVLERPAERVSIGIRQQRGLLAVLARAAVDPAFIGCLTDDGESALSGYDLTWQEKAALLSGDIRWIESRFGKLAASQRIWLDCRLQQEKW